MEIQFKAVRFLWLIRRVWTLVNSVLTLLSELYYFYDFAEFSLVTE